MRRSKGGMARKGQLAGGGEDAHRVVGFSAVGGQHENRFRKVHFLSDALHDLGA